MSSSHSPLVLVSAPAGYGKTTLLAQWRDRDERPFAWLSLDAADNDPVALMVDVIAALALVLDLDPVLGEAVNAPQPELEHVVLPQLVDACAMAQGRCVLVLDDVHLVTEPRCRAAIQYLVDRLPATCQLALATRTDPRLPLASLRAHGRLLEIRADDLALEVDEATALFEAAQVVVENAHVSQLVDHTEGWAAAVYLAALALRDRVDPQGFIDHFTGTTRHVADFLSEDVLTRQPPEVVDFLLHTSVLDELTPELCNAVTGGDGSDQMLLDLERANLFVVPLDEDRHAYRYHHLFADYLRAELVRRSPAVVAELHRRACRWYRDQRHIGPAIRHAHAGGDSALAAELVAAAYRPLAQRGQIETVREWMAGFADEQIEDHPPLAITAAWMAALEGEEERAERFASVATRGSWDGPMPDGSASLASALALMPKVAGLAQLYGEARRAVELEPSTSGWRPIALLRLGVAETLRGDLAAAKEALGEALVIDRALLGAEGLASTDGALLAYLGWNSLRDGHVDAALDYARRAYEVAERPGMKGHMPNIAAYAVYAHVARRADLAPAGRAVARVEELLPKATRASWWLTAHAHLLVAPVLSDLGRRDDALEHLDRARAILGDQPDAGLLPDWYDETARALRRSSSHQESAELSHAEWRILHLLETNLTLREIGNELCLSLNTVKTHTHSIYRKLGVSSRSEAVRSAPLRPRRY